MKNVLLIHGFAGSRGEVKPLYDFLIKKGFVVKCPLLFGHEGTKKDLSIAKYQHWFENIEKEYLELAKDNQEIIVIGFSMGGLLAINLYQKYKFAGLVTINTPIYYWDIKRIIKNLLVDFKTYSKKYFISSTDKPLPALIEFQKLLSKTKPKIKNIFCKTLIIQTQDDDTVNPKSADYIYKNLNIEKQIMKPKNGGHVVFENINCNEIFNKVYEFLCGITLNDSEIVLKN